MNRRQIIQESLRAPGLPNFPQPSTMRKGAFQGASRYIPISSINYDYLPMNLDSPKMLWVDLAHPAPSNLQIGSPIRLHLTPGRGINTGDRFKSVFQLDDIVGSRLILSPYRGSAWLPTVHQACDTPFGWGYNLTGKNVSTSLRSTKYGYGVPVGFIEYHPVKYSTRAKNLIAARIEEEWYYGAQNVPGWRS